MASSGNFYGSFSGGTSSGVFSLRVDWIQVKDAENNRSNVNFTWYIKKNNAEYQTWKQTAYWSQTTNGSDQNGYTFVDLRGVAAETWVYINSVSAVIPHTDLNSDGTKTFSVSCYLDMSGTSAGIGTGSTSITLDAIYTKCTAPTNIYFTNDISINSTIIIPSNLTINWSEGGAGIQNPITSYKIYWKIGAIPTLSNYDGYIDTISLSNPLSTSYNFTNTNNESARGSTYYFKIVTVGTRTNFDSSLSEVSASCTVNVKPSAPSSTQSSQTVKSTALSLSTTITAGSSNTGANSRRLFKQINAGSKEEVTGLTNYAKTISLITSSTPTQGNSITYNFYTFDGLEYSDPTTVIITRNKKPAISTFTISVSNSYRAKGNNYYKNITLKIIANKQCKLVATFYYGDSQSSQTRYLSIDQFNTDSQGEATQSYNLLDLLDGYNLSNDTYIKVEVSPTDLTTEDWKETGDSVNRNFIGSDTTKYIIIPGAPQIISFDQHYPNPDNTYSGYCWDKICVKFYEDESITTDPTINVTSKEGNQAPVTIQATINSQTVDDGYRYINITLPDNLKGGLTITVTVTLSVNRLVKKSSVSRIELYEPSSILNSYLELSQDTFNIYELNDESMVMLTCNAPCAINSSRIVDTGTYKINKCEVIISSNEASTSNRYIIGTAIPNDDCVGFNLNQSASEGQENGFKITISTKPTTNNRDVSAISNSFLKFGDFEKQNYNGTSLGYVSIIFTNIYGRTFTLQKRYNINYNKSPVNLSLTIQRSVYNITTSPSTYTTPIEGFTPSYRISLSTVKTQAGVTIVSTNGFLKYNTYYYPIGYIDSSYVYTGERSTNTNVIAISYVQETLTLQGKISCAAYTNSVLTAKLYYKIGQRDWVYINEVTQSVSNGTEGQSILFYTPIFTIPEITTTDQWQWKIVLTDNTTITTPLEAITSNINVVQHAKPNVVLSNVVGTITPSTGTRTGATFTPTFTTTPNISGVSTSTITYYIVDATTNIIISNSFSSSGQGVIDISSDAATWTQKLIYVRCVTTATQYITTTKTNDSNTFLVYLNSPTIAYRKNHLGINTANPDSNAILDIYSPSSSVHYINLHNTSGGKIQIDLINSTIDIV